MDDKALYRQKRQAQLDEWKADVAKLRARAAGAKADAQIEMNSVHGISVAGGTFPADIWHLFMQGAFGGMPYLPWPEPKHPAVWSSQDLEYANFGAPPPPKKPKKDKDKPGTTTGPPATTEPPPTTTEPPPTTTSPG